MLNKKKVMLTLVTLVFAVILCGAGSAATPGQTTATHKTIAASHNNDIAIIINGVTKTTAKGQKIYVNSTVKNLAKTSTNSFYAKYYLVSTKTMKNTKIFLGTQYFNKLHPGNYDNVVSSFTIPKTIGIGPYYVAAIAHNKHVAFSTDKTLVYSKEIDSGVVTVKKYGQYKWHTYLKPNNNVIIYSQFYNPYIGHMMKQSTQIGVYTESHQKNLLFWYITPKLDGKNSYYTILFSINTPENYYKYIFKPIMIKEGPNH